MNDMSAAYQSDMVFFIMSWGELMLTIFKIGCVYALWGVFVELRKWLKFLRTGFESEPKKFRRPWYRGW